VEYQSAIYNPKSAIQKRNSMKYRQALDLLNQRGNEVQGMNLGLHRMIAIMRALGNPQDRVPALHIAGTNGKGSVAAMAESILRSAGLRTGLYTSPHLVRIEERIRINGADIPPGRFAAAIATINTTEKLLLRRRKLDRPLTFFELVTAAAFLHFAEQEVDVAVVEVGLGGALDATNIITPRACVITGISYDHRNILGNTLRQIADEKAGIIKAGVPVISGCRAPAARSVIRRVARRQGAPLIEIERDCRIRIRNQQRGRCTIDLQTPLRHYRRVRLSLAGKHQAANAALAVSAVEALQLGSLNLRAVRQGLGDARWPGRLDEYRTNRAILLDGAHNPESAEVLRAFIRARKPGKIHLVFGALRDKDIRKIGATLFPLAEVIHLAPLDNARTALPGEIVSLHKRFRSRMRTHADSHAALRAAREACPRDGLVLVTGSLYLIGELLPVVKSSIRG
jgi:dihydrofolate synthase/folylpolyglutamate synthase